MISIRCSELDRILACPGSLTLCSIVAPRVGEEGLEGSALHGDAALRIVSELGGSSPDGLPTPDPKWPSLKFSKWISDYYVRHVRENIPEGWSLEVECPLAYQLGGVILSGHIDCVAVSPDGTDAVGWDLKTGYDPVDAADQNWQMLGYVVLMKLAYPQLKKATFYVVQPRNDEDEGFQRVSRMETLAGIDNFPGTLERAIAAAVASPMLIQTGRTQCKWCSAATQCPALQAERDLMKMNLTAEHLAGIRAQPDDATLADWVIAGRTLARPTEDAQDLAKERIGATGMIQAKDGTQITVKTTKGSYSVTDKPGMFAAVKEMLPEDKLAEAVKFSMTALREQVADHMHVKVTGKGSATEIVERRTAAYLTQGERKLFQYR